MKNFIQKKVKASVFVLSVLFLVFGICSVSFLNIKKVEAAGTFTGNQVCFSDGCITLTNSMNSSLNNVFAYNFLGAGEADATTVMDAIAIAIGNVQTGAGSTGTSVNWDSPTSLRMPCGNGNVFTFSIAYFCSGNQGNACNRNSCGGSGVYDCNGNCTKPVPTVPSPTTPGGYGNACHKNECGDGTGVIGCNGCTKTQESSRTWPANPPFTGTDKYGTACPSATTNFCGQYGYDKQWDCNHACASQSDDSTCPHATLIPTVPITVPPTTPLVGVVTCTTGTCPPVGDFSHLIKAGNTCTFNWKVSNAGNANLTKVTCSVSGPGLTPATSVITPAGAINSATTYSWTTPIMNNSIRYTLTCVNGPAVFTSQTMLCSLVPGIREF